MKLIAITTLLTLLAPFNLHAKNAEIELDGIILPYVDVGQGTPVLFLHGAISDLRVWEPYTQQFSPDFRFIAYTQRYFGVRDWPATTDNFQRSTHVRDLIAFIEGLDAGPVNMVTWSYSGEIGVHAMLKRPDLFASAIHYEPVLDRLVDHVPGGAHATRSLFSKFGPAVAAAQAGNGEDAALRFIEAVFKLPKGGASRESGEQMWRENGRTVLPYISMDPPDDIDCDQLGKLRTPTLVVQGKDSDARFAIMAEQVAACVANGVLVDMVGVNHDGPYRKPQMFAELIKHFLALVSTRESL